MTRTSFFIRTPVKQVNRITALSYINVGGEQFHALAVALIDAFKGTPRMPEASLKTILERFFSYYPKFKSQPAYLTPAERMGMLISWSRKSEIVDGLAFVLRQLVIDEIYANPLSYRETFDGLPAITSKDVLRNTATVLPVSALRALTQVLGITIIFSFTEHGKELRRREVYTDGVTNIPKMELVIQVQGDHYFPGVKNKADFASLGQSALIAPAPVEHNNEKTGTIAEMVALITADNARLLQTYRQWRQNLLTMVDGEELTTADLRNFYIQFLPQTNDGLAQTTEFFAKLMQVENKPVDFASLNSSGRVNELLASALAGWISTKQIPNVDDLFNMIEMQSSRASKSVL